MHLRCSLLGHEFGEAVIDERREKRSGGTVLVVREYRACRRCGEEEEFYENEGLISPGDTDLEDAPDDTDLEDESSDGAEPDEVPAGEGVSSGDGADPAPSRPVAAPPPAGGSASTSGPGGGPSDPASPAPTPESSGTRVSVDGGTSAPGDDGGTNDGGPGGGSPPGEGPPTADRDPDRTTGTTGPEGGEATGPESPGTVLSTGESSPSAGEPRGAHDATRGSPEDEVQSAGAPRNDTDTPQSAHERGETGAPETHGPADGGVVVYSNDSPGRDRGASRSREGSGPRFRCPECGFEEPAETSPRHEGDSCTRCLDGFIEYRSAGSA